VIIGFLGTAWLVVIIVVLRYCLAFDPTADPFANPRRDYRNGRRRTLKPNPIDVKTVGMFSRLRRRLGHHSHWNVAITKVLIYWLIYPKTLLNLAR
ncbi:oxidoreductase andH, partial [Colletotrichum asianum]